MSDLPTPTGMSQKDKNELVTSFLAVRRFIGFIGLALPVLLILYTFLAESSGPKDSISAYFYSGGREILVGSLFAIGVFLYAYKGFDKDKRKPTDKFVARAAAIFAIGVAFFPMSWAASGALNELVCTWAKCLLGSPLTYALHGIFATLFFACLATFCLVNFRRSEPGIPPDDEKRFRNGLYLVFGLVIVVCTIGFVAGSLLGVPGTLVFWAESLAVWAFGLSWLLKGDALQTAVGRLYSIRKRG